MQPKLFVTTSWDDGHPNDFRIAELLEKHNLPGTFYIPRTSEYGTMNETSIRDLGARFEVGAHTLSHVILTRTERSLARSEIIDSKAWVENLLGVECTVFCFPQGRFREEHVENVEEAGFLGARTVELLSTRLPVQTTRPLILPTTIQALDHDRAAYVRNAVKRRSIHGLWRYICMGAPVRWDHLASSLLQGSDASGGIFHLWGHSWEFQEESQWIRLERVLELISGMQSRSSRVTNGQLCQALLAPTEA